MAGEHSSYRRGLSYNVVSFVAVALLGTVSSIATARLYDIHVIGEFALASAPALVLASISSMREQAALVRELAVLQPRATRVTALFAAVMTFSFVLTVVMGLVTAAAVVVLFNGPIDQPDLVMPALVLLVSFTLLTNTCWNLDMMLTGFRAGRQLSAARIHQAVVFAVLAISLSFVLDDVWGLVLATVGSWATSGVHRVINARNFMRLRIPAADLRGGFDTLPDLIRFGMRLAPGGIADGLSDQSAIWVLGMLGSVPQVGAYSRVWMFASRFKEGSARISEMLYPTLVQRQATDDLQGTHRALVETTRYSAIVWLSAAAAGGGAAEGVMALFGAGFGQGANALVLMLLVPPCATAAGILSQSLIADGRPGFTSLVTIGRLAVTVSAVTGLTLAFGLTGAAGGLLVGYLYDLGTKLRASDAALRAARRRLWPAREAAALAGAYVLAFGTARGVDLALPGILGLAGALVGAVTFFAALWALGAVNERDRERLAQARAGLQRRRSGGAARRGLGAGRELVEES